MTDIERLIAIEELKKLKARYFRYIDEKKWHDLSSLFTEDVECDYRGATTDTGSGINSNPVATGEVLRGKEYSTDMIKQACERLVTVHHGHMPEIEITGPATATGIFAMADVLRFPPGESMSELYGYGHYHETFEKIDGVWKIKTLKLTRLRVVNTPAATETAL